MRYMEVVLVASWRLV